jgi:hypothetical protein
MRQLQLGEHSKRAPAAIAAFCAAAIVLSACSSLDSGAQTGGSSPSFVGRISQLFAGPSAQSGPTAENQPEDIECPSMDVRQGASTLSVASTSDPAAMTIRYQGTIIQLARECAAAAGNLTIKAGVQGRIILGPAGGPGQLEIPLRYALVREGPEPKTIWTKLYKIPVAIPDGQTNVTFTHVEDDLTIPRPRSSELQAYVIYVGFDALAAAEKPKRSPPPRKR